MFAKDTQQEPHTFYSIDHYPSNGTQPEEQLSKRGLQKVDNHVQFSNDMTVEMQQRLWNLRPQATKHFPSKLSVCLGMHVIIKYNIATECGVTNGAEGTVVGWKSRDIGKGKKALVTLFVKLINVPTPV